jgi:PAS domain S-box-containing protein
VRKLDVVSQRSVVRIVLIYGLFAAAWILLSDRLAYLLFPDPEQLVHVSTYKGWVFVAVTSLLLYVLLSRSWRSLAQAQADRIATLKLIETLTDSLDAAIFAKDQEGRYLLFNKTASRFVGKPADQVIGLDDRALFPPEQAEWLLEVNRRVILDNCVRTDEEVLDTPDGVRIFLATKGPLCNAAGDVIGTYGISSDITERRRTENALRENMKLMQLFVEHAPAAIAMFDREMCYLYASRRWRVDYGLGDESIIGRSHYDIFPEIGADWKAVHRRAQAGEVVRAEEDRFVRTDGAIQWLRWEVRPWNASNGHVGGILIMSEDITERKTMAEALAHHQQHLEELVAERTAALTAAETRLRLVIDSSADGIIELDDLGTIALANPAACAMLGRLPEELRGRNFHDALHYRHKDGTEYPASECDIVGAAREGKALRLEDEVFWRVDGSPLPVSLAVHPIRNGGRVLGAVMSFTDATERLRAEAAREAARSEAERLAKVKSEFLANMSHEIRTPLNGVLGLAQIGYRESAGRERARETFGRILESGRLLLTIINDILDFSKIEAGKLTVEQVPYAPAWLVSEAATAMNAAATAKGLSLIVDQPDDLPLAGLGDPNRISQILLNLLSNAIKFTHQGEIRLSVGCTDGEIVFTVADTGVGIAPDDIERLFQPFEQADSSTTRRFGGTGLGLAISRRLTDLMGGTLAVSSTVGEGSRFELRLPWVETEQPVTNPVIAIASEGPRLTGVRVLVAEDNEVNRLVLEDCLLGEGAQVVMAENGRQAILAVLDAGSTAFHIVLMDVQMPEMDGIAATRELRRLSPDLPVVGQTAHALKEEQDRCLAAGMVATLTKPIDLDQLVVTVARYARKSAGTMPDQPLHAQSAGVATMSPPETDATIDWGALHRRYQNRREFVARLVKLALEHNADTADRLRTLAAAGKIMPIGEMAHTIKGMAGNLAAARLEQIALRTLGAARANDETALEYGLALADAMEQLLVALRKGEGA